MPRRSWPASLCPLMPLMTVRCKHAKSTKVLNSDWRKGLRRFQGKSPEIIGELTKFWHTFTNFASWCVAISWLVLLAIVWYHRPQQEYLEANVAKIPGNCLSWPSSRGPCLGANCARHFATLPTDFRNYFDPSFGQLQWLVDSCNCIKSWLCICFEVGTHYKPSSGGNGWWFQRISDGLRWLPICRPLAVGGPLHPR